VIYAAFTLSGFDDEERNLTFVKTALQVLKLLLEALLSVPGCQTCMYKRGITLALNVFQHFCISATFPLCFTLYKNS